MASLRDVFDHAGKRVQLLRDGSVRIEGKAMLRGTTLLLESKLEPAVGDVVHFVELGSRLRVLRVEPQYFGQRIDHYRVEAEALRG